jgi:hypothetical protein
VGSWSLSPRCFPILVAAILLFPNRLDADEEVRVEINLHYQGSRDFTFVQMLSRLDASSFESDPARAIRPLLEEARKKLAIKEGYQPSIYGGNYWQMVTYDRYRYRVTESSSGRLITESEDR